MGKFKVGNVVKIVGNSYSGAFDIGEVVEVVDIMPYGVIVGDEGFNQDYAPEDLVLVQEGDNVNHPSHYNQDSTIECIDAMEAMSSGVEGVDPHSAYCWQNAFKYLWRWPYKNGVEDLKKARWYLDRLIDKQERKEEKETNV